MLLFYAFQLTKAYFDFSFVNSFSFVFQKKKKKKSEQSWQPAFWEKIQNTQENKRTLFNWTKQDRTCTFSRKYSFFFFSSYAQHRKTNNSTYLVSVGCGRLAEGKEHETGSVSLMPFWVSVVPLSFRQPPTSKWHKAGWISLSLSLSLSVFIL